MMSVLVQHVDHRIQDENFRHTLRLHEIHNYSSPLSPQLHKNYHHYRPLYPEIDIYDTMSTTVKCPTSLPGNVPTTEHPVDGPVRSNPDRQPISDSKSNVHDSEHRMKQLAKDTKRSARKILHMKDKPDHVV